VRIADAARRTKNGDWRARLARARVPGSSTGRLARISLVASRHRRTIRSTPTEFEELPLHATPYPTSFPQAFGAKAVHV
jgi:hypothetical protein